MPAFSGLFAPHWRSEARGVIVGLTSYITKGHLARAVLEATGWQTREVVDAMNADSGLPLTTLKVDGGMTADNLLMQFIADVLDVPVVRPMAVRDGVARRGVRGRAGRRLLARPGGAAGELAPGRGLGAGHGPGPAAREYDNWQRAVERTFGWVQPAARTDQPAARAALRTSAPGPTRSRRR